MWNKYSCNIFPHAFSDFQLRMPTLVWVFYHHLLSFFANFNSNDCLGQSAMPFWKVLSSYLRWHDCLEQSDTGTPVWNFLSWFLCWHDCLEQSDTGTPVWKFLSWFLRSHDFSKSQPCSTLAVCVDWSLHSFLRRKSIWFSLFTSGLTSTREFDCNALSNFRWTLSIFCLFFLLFLCCLRNVCMSGLKIYIYFYFPLFWIYKSNGVQCFEGNFNVISNTSHLHNEMTLNWNVQYFYFNRTRPVLASQTEFKAN